jgi:hypothetical protein
MHLSIAFFHRETLGERLSLLTFSVAIGNDMMESLEGDHKTTTITGDLDVICGG